MFQARNLIVTQPFPLWRVLVAYVISMMIAASTTGVQLYVPLVEHRKHSASTNKDPAVRWLRSNAYNCNIGIYCNNTEEYTTISLPKLELWG